MEKISQSITLSIVIPLCNEEESVLFLAKELTRHLNELNTTYEILFIDDGSRDATWEQITRISQEYVFIKGISLSRNFGHQYALAAGLQFSSGEAVITMDGDLQHPPEVIKKLFEEWKSGYKIVQTRRLSHKKTSLFKRLTSKNFYKLFSFFSGVSINEGSSDFRLIDRQVLEVVLECNDVNFFLRGIIGWAGFPTTSVTYQEGPRRAGKTKYNIKKMLKFASSAIISFSSIPIKLGIWIGIFTSLLAFIELVYILFKYFQGVTVPGWASTVGIISVLFGVQFILLGCIGAYIASIHECLKNRPKFIVNEKINL